MAMLTGLAVVWTWALALPVQMAWDGGVTAQARAALQRVEDGPKVRGVPLVPCVDVTTGRVGPLAAPYRECAVATSEGHFVTFTVAGSDPVRGSVTRTSARRPSRTSATGISPVGGGCSWVMPAG